MIKYTKGNLLNAKAQALVNTVNTVGVMGKGIALQFKNRFPNNYKIYRDACKNGTFKTGQVLVVPEGDLLDQKLIINFPSKAHWKAPSTYEYIKTGLKALKQAIEQYKITSIAIPPLGCGNGGLDWKKVKTIIEEELANLEIDIMLFEPNEQIKEILQKEDTKREVKLTPARAMLLFLMFNYESEGEQSSLFVANKLAYFLQRSGENLKLKFNAHHYGPYAVQLNHVLLHLNSVYLYGMEQNVVKPFDPLQLNYNKFEEIEKYVQTELSPEQKHRLKDVMRLLKRFESAFALELLATVDYVMTNEKTKSQAEILKTISSWNQRKKNLFQPNQVEIACEHLNTFSSFSFDLV